MWLFLYNILLTLGFFLVLPVLPLLFMFGSRYRDGFSQRLGLYPKSARALAGTRPVWVHAASVGEVRSAAQSGGSNA